MATSATLGKFNVTHAAANIEEVLSLSGLGKSNDLVEVTNFDSPAGTKEYIAGLADGSDVTITCNYIHDATAQLALIADVDSQATAAFTVTYDTTAKVYSFNAVCMSYQINPAIDSQNQIEFGIKVSGDITVT